ncbi:MAG: aldo/keto reductase [Planctomycetota bacterium]|jgi:predicted aldo/keto reductase-like oxidoreductase
MSDRRDFLKMLAGLTVGLNLAHESLGDEGGKESDSLGELLPMRPLGKTGKKVTMLGVGGHHTGDMSERDAQETIEAAIEGGIRFFDTAEGYQDGESEKRYGKFLTPKYREHVFLMTKCEQQTLSDAKESLDESLKRLKTDYLDLWQVHTLESVEDVDERIAGGVLDAMKWARQSGKVRHIGFTGHATPKTHVRMLEKTDIFETCQMPINVCDPSYKSFILGVLPILLKRQMGVLAMKTLGEGAFFGTEPSDDQEQQQVRPIVPNHLTVKDALHFVWSLPVSVIITGPDNADMLREKVELAKSFRKMSDDRRWELIEKVARIAVEGELEDYKYG